MTPVTDAAAAAEAEVDPETGVDPDTGPTSDVVALNLLPSVPIVVIVGGGLAVAARFGATPLLVAVAVTQALVAFAWVFGTGMPGRKGALMIAALAAAGCDVTVSVWPDGRLGTELAVIGLTVPVMFVHQLARGTARRQIVSSLSAVAVLVLAVAALPALIQLRHELGTQTGGRVVAAAVAAVAAALLAGYLVDVVVPAPRIDPEVPRGLLALVASIVVGGAVSFLLLADNDMFRDGRAIFLGAALAALAGVLGVAAAFVQHTTPNPPTRLGRALRPVLAPLLPLCLLAPAAFLLCLAIRG